MSKIYFPSYIIISMLILSILACDNGTSSSTPPPSNKKTTSNTNNNASNKLPDTTSKLQQELDLLEAQQGNSNRTIWQRPRMIIQRLGDLSDKTVADIGAGPFGYFSFQIVNEAKKVIAIDIDKNHLAFMDSIRTEILSKNKQDALETRLASSDNPNLKAGEADVLILMNIYAYLPNPENYLKILKNGLSKGGKLLLVDFKMRNLPIGPPQNEKIPLFIVEQNLEKAGFKIDLVDDRTLDYQYMVIASKN